MTWGSKRLVSVAWIVLTVSTMATAAVSQLKNPKLDVNLPGPLPLTATERAKLAQSLLGQVAPPQLGQTVSLFVNKPTIADKSLMIEPSEAPLGKDGFGRSFVAMTSANNLFVKVGLTTASTSYLVDCPVDKAAVVDWIKFEGGKLKPGNTLYSSVIGGGQHLSILLSALAPPDATSVRFTPKGGTSFHLYECDVTPIS